MIVPRAIVACAETTPGKHGTSNSVRPAIGILLGEAWTRARYPARVDAAELRVGERPLRLERASALVEEAELPAALPDPLVLVRREHVGAEWHAVPGA